MPPGGKLPSDGKPSTKSISHRCRLASGLLLTVSITVVRRCGCRCALAKGFLRSPNHQPSPSVPPPSLAPRHLHHRLSHSPVPRRTCAHQSPRPGICAAPYELHCKANPHPPAAGLLRAHPLHASTPDANPPPADTELFKPHHRAVVIATSHHASRHGRRRQTIFARDASLPSPQFRVCGLSHRAPPVATPVNLRWLFPRLIPPHPRS